MSDPKDPKVASDRGLDELFGGTAARPKPRTGLIVALLVGAGLATGLGLVCTAVPGVFVFLWAWNLTEAELDRVDSGYLGAEFRAGLGRLRVASLILLALSLVLVVFQGVLLAFGFYHLLWGAMAQALFVRDALPV